LREQRDALPSPEEWRQQPEDSYVPVIIYGTRVSEDDERIIKTKADQLAAYMRRNPANRDLRIIADRDVVEADVRQHTVVLIGGPKENDVSRLLERELPFAIGTDGITVSGREFKGTDIGVSLSRPSPFDPSASLLITAAMTPQAIIPAWAEQDVMIYRPREVRERDYWQVALGNFGSDYLTVNLTDVNNERAETGEGDPIPLPARTKQYPAPQWARDGIMYEIFVRSFADSDGDGIGDLRGLIAKLDYLNDGDRMTDSDLGVDVLWLMPIFESPSYHGYDITNPLKIDPEYGTLNDFQELARACHKRGMRIVLDFVANHMSAKSEYFQDAFLSPASRYDKWFYFTNISNTRCHNWYFRFDDSSRDVPYTGMPAFNINDPGAREFTFRIADFWLDPDGDGDRSDGADGLRCDHALGPPHNYWKLLRQEVKAKDPNVLLLAEAWAGIDQVASYFNDEFDMAFDFPFQAALIETITSGAAGELTSYFKQAAASYPRHAQLNRFINNHDMNRLASFLDRDQLELAALITFTVPGMPMIYYGEELGMNGQKDPADHGIRRPFKWEAQANAPMTASWYPMLGSDGDGGSVAEQQLSSDSLLNFYKRLTRVRQSHRALSRGRMAPALIDTRRALAYTVSDSREMVVVVANLHERTTVRFKIPGLPAGVDLNTARLVLTSEPDSAHPALREADDFWRIQLDTRGYRVWVVRLASEKTAPDKPVEPPAPQELPMEPEVPPPDTPVPTLEAPVITRPGSDVPPMSIMPTIPPPTPQADRDLSGNVRM